MKTLPTIENPLNKLSEDQRATINYKIWDLLVCGIIPVFIGGCLYFLGYLSWDFALKFVSSFCLLLVLIFWGINFKKHKASPHLWLWTLVLFVSLIFLFEMYIPETWPGEIGVGLAVIAFIFINTLIHTDWGKLKSSYVKMT